MSSRGIIINGSLVVGVTQLFSEKQRIAYTLPHQPTPTAGKELQLAYMCVLRPSHECDGCEECEEERKDKQDWLWEKQEAEYDYYRDEEYISYLERSE